MKIIFMGTPDFAVPTLTEIVSAGHEVVAVYTRAPKPAGRGQAERKSPIHLAAGGFGIPVHTPRTLRNEVEQAAFAALAAEVGIVVAYGLILPQPILDAPRLGCLNLHGSLLPRWRGAAPIQRAVLAGDARTGVMVMQMDEGLDTGPVGLVDEMPIGPDMTTGELHGKMMLVGADLMGRALAALERGSLSFTPQTEDGVTYAKKIEKAEARIDWRRPAAEVHNLIRGMSPFPGAWFELELGGATTRVKALRSTLASGSGAPGTILPDLTIACGDGAVRLLSVQREGKAAMDAATFLRGVGVLPTVALSPMPRYKLTIEYDGTPFFGWQRQAGAPSVQQVVEEAIEKMAGERVVIQAAGRTDSGVHALGQVVSFDLSREWEPFRIREALNFHTKPHPIAIVDAVAVPDDFEARFSAFGRHYEYRILNRRGRPALDDRRVWHCPKALDVEPMHAAAQLILGKHDFTTFRAAECQAKSPVKTLDRLDVSREGETIVVRASARSFLHSQVRSMVGSLKLVGEGKWTPRDFRAALDAMDRSRCGPLAPPEGLYLVKVDYEPSVAS